MTQQQFERWKDFAMRMARTSYRHSRRPTAKWIEEVVDHFFAMIDESDIVTIVNWDHSAEYPVGHPYHGRECRSSWCGCDGYRNKHGRPSPQCEECRGSGVHHALFTGPLICDAMAEFLYEYEPRRPECRACREDDVDGECRCGEIEQLWGAQWDEQWGGPVHCCVRAGLDFAAAPSAGVLGFTAGDVRRMYPEGVPDWVFPPGEQLYHYPGDEVNGMFAELPDEAGVVL